MKRFLVPILVGALVLLCGLSVAAAGIGVSGGYLFGKVDDDGTEYDLNGFVLNGAAAITGTFGVAGDAEFLKDEDDWEMNNWDVYATYALPFAVADGLELKALGGYGAFKSEDYDLKYKGFRVGAGANYTMDKISLDGEVTFGLGTKISGTDDGDADFDASSLAFRVAGSYAVMENVAVQAGFLSRSFGSDDVDYDFGYNGFFVGAKASF